MSALQVSGPSPLEKSSPWGGLWLAALIALAGAAAYAHSLSGPFIFDDQASIVENQSIRHLATAFWPDHGAGQTVEGRPVLNLSLALNYAIGGTQVRGYHLTNVLIHILAGLTLFGLLRQTLKRWSALTPTRLPANGVAQRVGDNALHLAFFIALLWTVHPLQTEAVTYVIQRAESLMGLFFLFTFYAFVRSTDSARPGLWRGLCVASFLLGIGTKEVIVTALPLLFLYDRAFVSGSAARAWRAHRGLFLVLGGCLVPLVALVASSGWNRSGSIGLGVGVSPLAYAFTQPKALLTYLKLCFLPFPLILEYGTSWAHLSPEFFLQAFTIGLLLVLTAVALVRAPALGFLGAWFFTILAPTSLLPGTTQMIVEHRMYLPLAAVMALLVLGLHRWLGRTSFPVLLVLAVGFGALTFRRNHVYRSEETLWADTVAKRPDNARARVSLGNALRRDGRPAPAVAQYETALQLDPDYAEAHYNLGIARTDQGRRAEAILQYEAALRLRPDYAEAHNNLGNALVAEGRPGEAIPHYETAQRLDPQAPLVHYNLGRALAQAGRLAEAIAEFDTALRLDPADSDAHTGLGNALASSGHLPEAIVQYQEAARIQPNRAGVHYNLGNAFQAARRDDEAVAEYATALRLQPDFTDAQSSWAVVLSREGRIAEAVLHFSAAVRLAPDSPDAHYNLAIALAHLPGRRDEAVAQGEAVLRLRPGDADARRLLANLERAARTP